MCAQCTAGIFQHAIAVACSSRTYHCDVDSLVFFCKSAEHSSSFPPLTPAQQVKLKQLTVVSIAEDQKVICWHIDVLVIITRRSIHFQVSWHGMCRHCFVHLGHVVLVCCRTCRTTT